LKSALKPLYNCEDNLVADRQSNSRRWTVIASGLLCGGLAVVVIYTKRSAFISPLAVVVVSAIGLAAVLLQLRFYNREHSIPVRTPMSLNFLGVGLALGALFSDLLHLSSQVAEVLALGAVISFAISGTLILQAVRKRRAASKQSS